ncbi:MAG: FAD-dependent oxidoreductase [Sterolibacterium sp.]|nr:FAD-dependent oxidoreductase [Sterolibacterium sp.]MBP9800180.1 FAD-dependent oxidoreductase [Sterolibacterium sp.]
MNRRDFLTTCAALGVAACGRSPASPPLPPGELSGSNLARGHRLQATEHPAPFPPADETRRIPLLIIGGGIAGLSAGWCLQRAGFTDFLITELEDRIGGNSRYGENPVSRYPLGAHYLPLPGPEASAVRALLADFGILQGDPQARQPIYDERYLCATPQERLYLRGRWHDGLLPPASDATEQQRIHAFQQRIHAWKTWRDPQGRPAFALPMEHSSRDPSLLALDRLTFGAWLRREQLDCPALRWYLNYACRDDFGTHLDHTSAWAGLHYFVSRDGQAANASGDTVLTAPEGNGWLVRRLEERLHPHLRCNALVTALRPGARHIDVDLWLADEQRSLRIEAQQVIWAAPLFVLGHVWPDAPPAVRQAAQTFSYAPWLVANLTLSELPHTRTGAPLAWDNVLHEGPGLGYVVATHQQIRVRPGATVISYYRAFDDADPRLPRRQLQQRPREYWAEAILNELGRPHPELRAITQRLDVFRHGHAMIRPLPGLLWGADSARRTLTQTHTALHPRLQLAHADLSGMSLFEEANYRGVLAAERLLDTLNIPHTSLLHPTS